MKKNLSLGLLLLLVLSVQGCSNTDVKNTEEIVINEETNVDENKDIHLEEDYLQVLSDVMEDLPTDDAPVFTEDAKRDGSDALGSCNSIDENSTCWEYYGSFWTEGAAELDCEEKGTLNIDPCPRDFGGGCNTGSGTEADMVVWMYTRGEGGITEESMKYAKMACDMTGISNWIE